MIGRVIFHIWEKEEKDDPFLELEPRIICYMDRCPKADRIIGISDLRLASKCILTDTEIAEDTRRAYFSVRKIYIDDPDSYIVTSNIDVFQMKIMLVLIYIYNLSYD
jgi:hypothetical protein